MPTSQVASRTPRARPDPPTATTRLAGQPVGDCGALWPLLSEADLDFATALFDVKEFAWHVPSAAGHLLCMSCPVDLGDMLLSLPGGPRPSREHQRRSAAITACCRRARISASRKADVALSPGFRIIKEQPATCYCFCTNETPQNRDVIFLGSLFRSRRPRTGAS